MTSLATTTTAHARFAAAVRRLAELSSTLESEDRVWEEAASMTEAIADRLASAPSSRPAGVDERSGCPRAFIERSPVSGKLNPHAPPLVLEPIEDGVAGIGVYGAAFQGAPGCVHGGHVATAFDHVAGRVAAGLGTPVLTGKLSVRYLKPTRIGRPIRYEARLRESRHRLVTVDCAAFDGTTKTATAEIVFLELPPAYFREVIGGPS